MDNLKPKYVMAAVAAVIFIGLAWFFVSPLFIDRAVDEELPFSTGDPQLTLPSRLEVAAMDEADRQNFMDELMEAAASALDVVMDENMASLSSPKAILSGTFRDADTIHHGRGEATLFALPDGSHLLRFENFRVTNGPGLVVLLAEHPDPQSAADVMTGYVSLGKLKGNVGSQNYAIPADVDVAAFGSTVIWCELFDVLFSPAALEPI